MQTPTFGGAPMAPQGLQMPGSRYILPQFEERTAYGYKRQDPYNKLFEDRVIFLGVQVDDASADDVMAQLLVLESQDPDRDIVMYINSPGGSFTAMTAIYDTMQYVSPQIQTVVLGQAASAAAVLLAAGAPGKRLAPRHYHLFEEEHALVLEGEPTLLLGDAVHRLKPGDYVAFPAGLPVAHAFRNDSGQPCHYLMIGERLPHDVCVYPDSNKVCVNALGRGRSVLDLAAVRGYWDGENGE